MDRPTFMRKAFIRYLKAQPAKTYYENRHDWQNPISKWIRRDYDLRVKANRWGMWLDDEKFTQSAWIKQFFDELWDNVDSHLLTAKRCLEILENIKMNRDNLREKDSHVCS